MASFTDLLKHLETTLTADERLHAECVYRGTPLPAWLTQPLDEVQANADGRAPVLVLNVKGRRVPDTVCLLRLEDLERLIGDGVVGGDYGTQDNARKRKSGTVSA